MNTTDVLMITYRRPEYVRRSLARLLETAGDDVRVWLWHNGDDEATLAEVHAHLDHPRIHRFHHSRENVRLREPTNWLWRESDGEFVAKVDDDCLVPHGWVETLTLAHVANPKLGVIGCWRFADEDFRPHIAAPKIQPLAGNHAILQNFWVQGSGYLMKRSCVERHGPLAFGQSFSDYCIMLALDGWVNGWHLPFLREEHMDDPRSPYTLLHTDEDLRQHLPLSAQVNGVKDLASWTAQLERSALLAQSASINPARYRGLRLQARRIRRRVRRIRTGARW